MKYLKIENNKGFYLKIESENEPQWSEIDKISKEDLITLLEAAISDGFEMDEYQEDNIGHKAHQIVYKSIWEKMTDLLENKTTFLDECDSQFKGAIEKYDAKEKSDKV